jgi:hypothetical protein
MKKQCFLAIEQFEAGQALARKGILDEQIGKVCLTGRRHCFYLEASQANQCFSMLSSPS